MVINHTIATVYNPNMVYAIDVNGKSVVLGQKFNSRKEALAFIREQGFTYMSKKDYSQESVWRWHHAAKEGAR